MARRFDAPVVSGSSLDTAEDPRVKRLKAEDPNFDPRGKSDTYLDKRIELLDEAEKKPRTSDREQARRDHEDRTPPAPRKSTIDEAYERADAEARRRFSKAAPEGAIWVRGDAGQGAAAAPTPETKLGSIEQAEERAAEQARKDFASAPPEGALYTRR